MILPWYDISHKKSSILFLSDCFYIGFIFYLPMAILNNQGGLDNRESTCLLYFNLIKLNQDGYKVENSVSSILFYTAPCSIPQCRIPQELFSSFVITCLKSLSQDKIIKQRTRIILKLAIKTGPIHLQAAS